MYSSYSPLLGSWRILLATAICVSAISIIEGDAKPTSIHPRDSTPTPNPLDYAPDTSQDEFPPYPPMQNTDGSNVTVQNLRGVRLFGWKGCSSPDVKTISDSYDDFEKLAAQEALWKNIDWSSQAAQEIWGHGAGNKALTDDRKAQIQQIYQAAEQVRAKAWWVPPYDDIVPPWMAWRYLWIEVACSSVKGDPDNGCKDRPDPDPDCPGGRDPPPGGMNSDMEAFSNPLGKYSKTTFCEHFFLRMSSLGGAIDNARTLPPDEKNDLWEYQNRARTVFHEVTHLNYFMNAPDKSPFVDDVELPFGPKTRRTYLTAYGPERIKILANYEAANKGGFYTQRNADSFAWYAVAKYVEQQLGIYPSDPVITQKPSAAPKNGDKKDFATSSDDQDGSNADINSDVPPTNSSDMYWVSNCPDHSRILSDTFGVDSVGVSQLSITCDTTQLSGVPSTVFQSPTGNVYDKFCFDLDSTIGQEWTVNAQGVQQASTPSFDLKWETNNQTLGCGQNVESCRDVFRAITNSSCGHQGSDHTIMTTAGKVDVQGCGTYSYTINSGPGNPSQPNGTAGGGGQQIALASYIPPAGDPDTWNRIINYPADKVSILVANVLNGPDNVVNTDWQNIINRAAASGKRVIGYVRTGYLGVSEQKFQTRLGSTDLADWVSQIQTDVDLWYTAYGDKIGGIFFDEGWNQCGDNNQYAELYRLITETVKRQHPGAFTVLNPGDHMPQCFEHSADTLLTFESSYENYMNASFYTPNGWVASDTRKNWHIVYNVKAEDAAAVAALALERGAGLVHITNTIMPNPYNHLPDDTYMQTLMNSVSGGKPLLADPLPWPNDGRPSQQPSGLTVVSSDYSSVSLSWPAPASAPLAFAVWWAGSEVARLPGTMSRVTIGNIPPGLPTLTFTICAIGGDGQESAPSNTVSASTWPLKNNQAIVNFTGAGTPSVATYSADVLVPFAFVRIYITDPDTSCTWPAWPTNYNGGHYICAHYMVEDDTLYKYSGALLNGTATNYPWDWTPTGNMHNVVIKRTGYTYTWTLPIGTDTVDTNYAQVQAQGYGPLTNVFTPCPDHWNSATPNAGASCVGSVPYDCHGATLCSTMNVKFCNDAINSIADPRSASNFTSNGAGSGVCMSSNAGFGCKTYIQGTQQDGTNCFINGQDMWDAYQNIRKVGGCSRCGSYHIGNGCVVSVNYDYDCPNKESSD